MRGLAGIIVAIGLGILGAILNFFYLAQQASKMEKVSFVAIDSSAQLNLGDKFKEAHFSKVDIPRNNLGNLEQVGVLWSDRSTVIDMQATKAYRGGELLLQQDLRTPPEKAISQLLGANELARSVPVDPRSFVPELLAPGDLVSFVVPQLPGNTRTGSSNQPGSTSTSTQVLGPFQVLSLGARLGDSDVRRANNLPRTQEHLLSVRIRRQEDGRLEAQAELLFQYLSSTSNSPLQLVVHPASLRNQPLP